MGSVELIVVTVVNAAPIVASHRSSTRRCASHHIVTQRASRWGHPGGFRAFSEAQNQRQLSPTCLNSCLVPDDCFYRCQTGALYWQQCSTSQTTWRAQERAVLRACKQFDPIMLSQLVDHGHIGRCPRHCRTTGGQTSK